MTDYLLRVGEQVTLTVHHNWMYLIAGVVVAAAITTYVGTDRVTRWLEARTLVAIPSAVAASVATPTLLMRDGLAQLYLV